MELAINREAGTNISVASNYTRGPAKSTTELGKSGCFNRHTLHSPWLNEGPPLPLLIFDIQNQGFDDRSNQLGSFTLVLMAWISIYICVAYQSVELLACLLRDNSGR